MIVYQLLTFSYTNPEDDDYDEEGYLGGNQVFAAVSSGKAAILELVNQDREDMGLASLDSIDMLVNNESQGLLFHFYRDEPSGLEYRLLETTVF